VTAGRPDGISMNKRILLILGDVFAIAVVTLIGFATHRELGTAPISRMLATLIPLLVGWGLAAPWLGLFDLELTADPRQLWRPGLATLLAGPLATFLRGVALNSVILPLFVAVFTASAALAMTSWRGLWWLLNRPKTK
jgi:DUF3054 family protein